MSALEAGVLASLVWMLVGLTASVAGAWRRGTSRVPGIAIAPAWPGVAYAFGPGMSPRAKESASQHPLLYATGVMYHAGIAAAAIVLLLALVSSAPPLAIGRALALLPLAGAAAGVALLVRRRQSPLLRAISAPDDYAANLLVDAWLLSAALAALAPPLTPAFLFITIVLGFYAPLGKIRHCVFFLLSRGEFGARLGRRGIIRHHANDRA